MPSLNDEDKVKFLNLQMLVARAAQKDSLGWWEDDALTSAGGYLLERLFPHAPAEAGHKLAFEGAKTRYRAAFAGLHGALHLFNIDPQKTPGTIPMEIPISIEEALMDPIPSIEALRQRLLEQIGSEPGYEVIAQRAGGRLEIRVQDEIARGNKLRLAQTLAWATLEGEPEASVFPYILKQS